MRWQHKARIMRLCASLPAGARLYKLLQQNFGRLDANPMSRIPTQIKMARWILDQGMDIEGKQFFEVGTGHKPIVPIGFFLSGAESIVTVDLNRRLDLRLTRRVLAWMVKNRRTLESMYSEIVDSALFSERLALIERLWSDPHTFLKEANIQYLAPADAADTDLPANSIDYHFSITVLEHIPLSVIRDIFIEARRILSNDGVALHFIDLSDHFQHQDGSITSVNFLRFTEEEWLRLAGNEFAYCNRLRVSDYLALFRELSFDILRLETNLDDEAMSSLRQGFPLDEGFKSYSLDDLCSTSLNVLLRQQGIGCL